MISKKQYQKAKETIRKYHQEQSELSIDIQLTLCDSAYHDVDIRWKGCCSKCDGIMLIKF